MKYTIHVRVRPGCEEFLKAMSEYYEIFIFTASVPEYANPVIDKIDPQRYCHLRLFRSNCSLVNGMFVKDLSKVGRNLHNVIIIDVFLVNVYNIRIPNPRSLCNPITLSISRILSTILRTMNY